MLNILLHDNANRAKEVIENFVPRFKSKEEYLAAQDKLSGEGDRVFYGAGEEIKVKLNV